MDWQSPTEWALVGGAFLGRWLMPRHDWRAPAIFAATSLAWIGYGLAVGSMAFIVGALVVLPAEARAVWRAVQARCP